jgi:hypothetical protein
MDEELSVKSLPTLVKEWMTTEDELRTLSAEIREKRKRVKLVRQMIMKIMKGGKIGRLNVSSGAVTARSKNTKSPLTKKYIVGALTEFFAGDKAKAEACAAYLDQHRPVRVVENLTLDPISSS